MRKFILPVIFISFLAIPSIAEPPEKEKSPPTTDVRSDVDKLIEQLADEDFAVRDKAAKKLLELGAEALPALRKAIDHPDLEARKRITDLVPTIETNVALSPKVVTLDAEKQTLKQIFDEMTKQTGYRYEFFNNNPNQTFSFKFDKKPLWQVLDTISESAGLTIQQSYQDDVVRLQGQDAHVPYICYDGPFRVVATGFQLFKNNDFGVQQRTNPNPNRSESLTLNLMVYAEPKTPMLSLGQASITTAYDENKVSMNPDDADRNNGNNNRWVSRSPYGNGGYRMFNCQASASLFLPGDSTRKVKYIKGNVPVTLITSQKQEVLTSEVLKAKGKQYTIGNITINLEDVTENPGGGLSLKMSINNSENKNPNDYSWQNSIYQRIEVQDADGHKFNHAGSNWGNSGPGHMNITLNLSPPVGPKVGPATKFMFQDWKTMQSVVTFEFKDLPLP
jgi:hypothetical protein